MAASRAPPGRLHKGPAWLGQQHASQPATVSHDAVLTTHGVQSHIAAPGAAGEGRMPRLAAALAGSSAAGMAAGCSTREGAACLHRRCCRGSRLGGGGMRPGGGSRLGGSMAPGAGGQPGGSTGAAGVCGMLAAGKNGGGEHAGSTRCCLTGGSVQAASTLATSACAAAATAAAASVSAAAASTLATSPCAAAATAAAASVSAAAASALGLPVAVAVAAAASPAPLASPGPLLLALALCCAGWTGEAGSMARVLAGRGATTLRQVREAGHQVSQLLDKHELCHETGLGGEWSARRACS